MADLTLIPPNVGYFALLNTASVNGLSSVLQVIQDGMARNSPLSLSQISLDINTTMGGVFSISGVTLSATATQINNVCVDASFASFNTSLKLPNGTTVQRPVTPSNGDLRYNSTTQSGELYAGGTWMTLNAGNPSGYYAGGPTYLQDTFAAGTFNLAMGTNPSIMTSRTECTVFGDSSLQANSNGSALCAFGYQSLILNSTGNNNSSFGHISGSSITTGFNNSLFGKSSGRDIVTGDNNSFFGFESGLTSTGDDNAIYGALSGRSAGSGDKNSYFGSNSSINSINVSNCCSYGYASLRSNLNNIQSAFGAYSAYTNVTGDNINAFGYQSLYSNAIGNDNSAFSTSALFSNIDGDYNCAFGLESIYLNTAGNSISGFGHRTLYHNTVSGNSAFGSSAGYANTTGTIDAFGYNCLVSNTTGLSNTGVGRGALSANISGNYNCAFGEDSSSTQTNKSFNSSFGYNSAKIATASGTCSFGYNSLFQSSGDYNSGFGTSCLLSNTSGTQNTGVGFSCLDENEDGSFNTAIGSQSLKGITTGGSDSNTAVGYSCGNSIETGSNNSFFGALSGASGTKNGLIGCTLLGASTTLSTGLTNAAAIGYQASVTSSDTIVLGKVGTNVGIGKTSASFPLDVVGIAQFKGISSGYTSTGVLKGQSGFSTAGATTATIDFPINTSTRNILNSRIYISVINSVGDKCAYSSSNAAAFYNGAASASTGTLPIITMTPTAGYAPTAVWSISGNNLRLSLTGVAGSSEIWVVSYEYHSTFNTAT